LASGIAAVRGKFIVFEGGEGAGKSTQVRLLAEHLRTKQIPVHVTREVGGAPLAEEIRHFWLAERTEAWDPLTELLLIMAARREHLVKTVWPKLEEGIWVISDRFNASSIAYQGMVMGLGADKVRAVYQQIAGDFSPDCILLLDLPVTIASSRISQRELDRYERQPPDFHKKLRQAYLELARSSPELWQVIDATRTPDQITATIAQHVLA
jgi:dTMP kinase